MEVGNQNKITRDDWISRFFGYLGSLEYVYEKNETTSPREWSSDSVGDNIVYIYGVPRGGKTRYREQISRELGKKVEDKEAKAKAKEKEKAKTKDTQGESISEKYVCCGFDFKMIADGRTALQMQQEMSKAFGALGFKFPCLEYAAAEDRSWIGTLLGAVGEVSGIAGGVEKLATLEPIEMASGAKDIIMGLYAGREYVKTCTPEEKELLKELQDFVKDEKKTGALVEMIDSQNPYKFFQVSLATHAKKHKKNVVVLVDNFHLCHRKAGDTEKILKMMYSVPNVVWVLFSDKNPSENIVKFVPECNRWRMGGMNEEHTRRFLEIECPGMFDEWYKTIYSNTGGYYGLLELCVAAHRERKLKIPEDWIECGFEEGEEDTLKPEHACEYISKVESWLQRVWNGGPWKDKGKDIQSREHPILFLFQREYERLSGNADGKTTDTFLPCLCFLVERSKENLGTIRQFCWEKNNNISGVISQGMECVNEIVNNTPFCLEFVEHPGVYYLDPVIVKVLTKFDYYEEWLKKFTDAYVPQMKTLGDSDMDGKDNTVGIPRREKTSNSIEKKTDEDGLAKMVEQMVKNQMQQYLAKQIQESMTVLDTKAEDALPKEEAKDATQEDGQPEAPTTPSPLSENKLTQISLDKTDHEKDDDLPGEKISDVEVKPVDDNDGEEKIDGKETTNDRKDDPPDNQ
ncbi:MAG: hypothetical protein IJY10_04335 [Lachnospiraceae bacterium]|nr:hypothetical protein [Lachnospiraceae bacterium]